MPDSPILVKRLVVPKAADVLAEHLRERILAGALAEGSPLPTERELGVHSGLSRASVREALRILESEGLIQTRPGRNGGASVRQPTADSIARSVGLFVRGRRIRLKSLLETREAIEPAVARLAALHRTDQDVAALKSAQARLKAAQADRAAYLEANVDWHLAVANASHNEPLIGFMTAISTVIQSATENPQLDSDEVRGQTIAAHERIQAAILAGDSAGAERRMARHVRAYGDQMRDLASGDSELTG
ncbi:MAG TPA: FadR/GntR family transcriptional regulator [Alphaproteobacteria bacterium]|jgi:DNA-binding FadR family transcriptional regulator|nr:FadR/GntR family transcriptional regulator [Alphaproteobacteria bacterium]